MSTVRRTAGFALATATAGASVFALGATAAQAEPIDVTCDAGGTLVGTDICELAFTSTPSEAIVPTRQMGDLEVLLVGAGGNAATPSEPNTNQYAVAGGGGAVTFVDATSAEERIEVIVPSPGAPGGVRLDGVLSAVANGGDGVVGSSGAGGSSGSNQPGSAAASLNGGAGGGAGGQAADISGGAGRIVGDAAPSGSLFAGDTRCFGGGGAVHDRRQDATVLFGQPGCGGGSIVSLDAAGIIAPVANSGGGAAGTVLTSDVNRRGADGFVALRWRVAEYPVIFETNGHGTAPAAQSVASGALATEPITPTADGFEFGGWFTDSALTVPVDFSLPITQGARYYAKWTPALAETGAGAVVPQIALGASVLLAGAALLVALRVRRPRES